MNKEAKKAVLKALCQGEISMVEARKLIRMDGKIIIDLSSQGKGTEKEIYTNLEKYPGIRNQFLNIISLGNGKETK